MVKFRPLSRTYKRPIELIPQPLPAHSGVFCMFLCSPHLAYHQVLFRAPLRGCGLPHSILCGLPQPTPTHFHQTAGHTALLGSRDLFLSLYVSHLQKRMASPLSLNPHLEDLETGPCPLFNSHSLDPVEQWSFTTHGVQPPDSTHPAPVLLIEADGSSAPPCTVTPESSLSPTPHSQCLRESVRLHLPNVECVPEHSASDHVLSRTNHCPLPGSLTGLPAATLPSRGCLPTWQKEPLHVPVGSDLLRTPKCPKASQVPPSFSSLRAHAPLSFFPRAHRANSQSPPCRGCSDPTSSPANCPTLHS